MTATDAPTRLLIIFWIGGRELDDARQMLRDLTNRAPSKPLFVSDELPHYGTVHGELFLKLGPAVPTEKPERPTNPRRGIDAGLDYATVHNTCRGAQQQNHDHVFRAKTPAMEAGVVNHQSTFTELLAYPAHIVNELVTSSKFGEGKYLRYHFG